MSTYLFRLGKWAFRRRRWVLGFWLAVAVTAIVLATVSGGQTNDSFTIPGTESQRTTDLLEQKLPALGGAQTQVVFAVKSPAKVTDQGPRAGIEAAVAQLRTVPQVASVSDPFTDQGVAPDQQVALGWVQYTAQPADVEDSTLDKLEDAVAPAKQAGVQVEYSGSVYPGWRITPSELPELIGLAIALIILLITFGAVVAAGVPIVNAIIGVVIALMGVTALASVVDIASASTTVALMLGLSCGIDYGLFILFRHRNNLIAGMTPEESASLALGTAGSSVVFAGLTVIIALCGLAVVGIPFLTLMGLCAAAAVSVALLIALTLLPAILGFAGPKVAKFIDTRLRPGHHEEVARITATEPARTFGATWARFVVRFRIPVLVLGVGLLLVLAIPAASMDLGLPSAASQPESSTQRKAYDLTAESFGPGFNGPLLVVADGPVDQSGVQTLVNALRQQPDVAAAGPLAVNNEVAVVRVIPTTGPNSDTTADLVHHIRDNRAAIENGVGAPILVGGSTASNIDVSTKLSDALPVFLLVVVGLAFVLLTFAFRTILVPIKSILGFLLSIGAAFGAEVAMFQWGWGEDIFDITPTETISFLPILMLAIIFGLSSDYEVFVVSRIKEDYTTSGDARGAVARGTGLSARVVTAAALIMFSIFVAFMFTDDPTIKVIGFSFAVGVFLDAFVVRLTLVPATMAIVRAKLWYHPQWFAKYVPDPDIEGKRLEERLAGPAPTGGAGH
ncbi:MMPL family transporter [Embleya hyalina]|uniref:Membrane protein n=1 Tax=Embleya hyalina TaxID=516124 RepID=A0A401YTG1_9ACTN|nr:MMPL family transporter [Embleya hyalina]GCD97903.1 membrane protein [Embleya hyalina]